MDDITDHVKFVTEGLANFAGLAKINNNIHNLSKVKSESDSQQDAVDRVRDNLTEKFEQYKNKQKSKFKTKYLIKSNNIFSLFRATHLKRLKKPELCPQSKTKGRWTRL